MIRAVLADTGPLYAAVDPEDEHHARAVQELQKFDRNRREVMVPYPTLLEAYSLILFRLGKNVASDWLTDMGSATLVNPMPEDYRLAGERIRSLADQPITLFDAVTAVVAVRLKVEVWTYDYHFDVMRIPVWR
jgi:predicted nucleic acid-binding protein